MRRRAARRAAEEEKIRDVRVAMEQLTHDGAAAEAELVSLPRAQYQASFI